MTSLPNNRDRKITYAFWIIASFVAITVSGLMRPLWYPKSETHYAGVAWEMLVHHSFILPLNNGLPYSQKPPLLFWLLQAGWELFGVNNWWPRVMPGFFAIGCLFLSYRLALLFWPQRKWTALIAPTILLGTFNWVGETTTLRFDVLLTFFCLLGYIGLVLAGQKKPKSWLIVTLAIGGGLLAKGPVALLYLLWPALLAPVWLKEKTVSWKTWYTYLAVSTLVGILIVLAWAIPATIIAGKHYADMIFFKQTSGRLGNQFHLRHLGFYVQTLLLQLLPWLIYAPFWLALLKLRKTVFDNGLRFCSLMLLVFFAFALLVTMEEARYLLPLIPIIMLMISRTITDIGMTELKKYQWPLAVVNFIAGITFIVLPMLSTQGYHWYLPWFGHYSSWWGVVFLLTGVFWLTWRPKQLPTQILAVTATGVITFLVYVCTLFHAQAAYYDITGIAQTIHKLQSNNHPVAYIISPQVGYSDEFAFTGRLTKPITLITAKQIPGWRRQHPNGWIVRHELGVAKGPQDKRWFPYWKTAKPAIVVFEPPLRS